MGTMTYQERGDGKIQWTVFLMAMFSLSLVWLLHLISASYAFPEPDAPILTDGVLVLGSHAVVRHGEDAEKVRDVFVRGTCPDDLLRVYYSYSMGRWLYTCNWGDVVYIMFVAVDGERVYEVTSLTVRKGYLNSVLVRDAYIETFMASP